jgi:hypothetical protein
MPQDVAAILLFASLTLPIVLLWRLEREVNK